MKRDELIKSEMLKVTGGGFNAEGETRNNDYTRSHPTAFCAKNGTAPYEFPCDGRKPPGGGN